MCKAEAGVVNLHYPISQGGVWVDSISLRKPIIHNDYPSLPNKKGLPKFSEKWLFLSLEEKRLYLYLV